MTVEYKYGRLVVKNSNANEREIIQANLNTPLDWVKQDEDCYCLFGVNWKKAEGIISSGIIPSAAVH